MEWLGVAGLVIGTVALLMGVQPFAQAVWGRPRLQPRWDTEDIEDLGHVLWFAIGNAPRTSRLAKILGITTASVADLAGAFQIVEQGTERKIVPIVIPDMIRRGFAESRARHVSLPASDSATARFPIIRLDNGKARVLDLSQEHGPTLGAGSYEVIVVVSADGRDHRYVQRLVIRAKDPLFASDLFWLGD